MLLIETLLQSTNRNTHTNVFDLYIEPGQYLDGRPSGKTRLLLEEVLLRPAGGAHPVVCVGPNAPV